jgi:outer membrane protein
MKRLTLIAVGGLLPGLVFAEQLPRWEIGLGTAALSMPHYRGADERHQFILPMPYVAYRLDWLKVDRDGVKARLFDSDSVELNVSVGATPPLNSGDNRARQGMPDIKPTLEIGPSLDVALWRDATDRYRLDVRLPLRAAFMAHGGVKFAGWTASPTLNLDASLSDQTIRKGNGWRLGLLAGPIYSDRRQHGNIYSVDPQFARSYRPAYDAPGGYSGLQLLASMSRRWGDVWIGGYARLDSLRGATFESSPLVRKGSYVSAGFALTWTFSKSSDMVEVID